MARPRADRSEDRKERVPFGVAGFKMSLDSETERRLQKEGKVGRWVNDVDNRLQRANAGGYEFVNDSGHEAIKIGSTEEEQERDTRIRKRVGKDQDGNAIYAYLMAIPEHYYDEDQAKKEEVNQRVDDAIRGAKPPGLETHGVNPTMGGAYVKNVDYKP